MADETRTLANFAAELKLESVPAHVRARAIDIIVDQLGCEIGCSELDWAKQVHDTRRKSGGAPEATVVRYGDRLPAPSAAFINSTFGHSFEFDDGNPRFHGHPGAELVPALLAIAERDHISGHEFLAAFIAAYEVRGRIGYALSPEMNKRGGPQYSTTCGPFGTAAGVARLLMLDAEGIRQAMAIAGSYSGGLMQYDQGGGSVKRIYTAIAAASGITAATLAQAGMTGPEEVLEGKRGLLRIYSTAYRPEKLTVGLGTQWMIETLYFKPYSCAGGIHAAIDGLRSIVTTHQLEAEEIEAIEVDYPTGIHQHVAVTAPEDLLGMQFSTSYSLALTALRGGNTPREYTMNALHDHEIQAFAAKVTINEDPALATQHEGHLAARVHVRTQSGMRHQKLVTDARGAPGAPLSSAEVDAKFRAQVVDSYGAERCHRLLGALRKFDTLDDVAVLLPLLVSPQL
jgi:2-methylcitrate dehydratase PrpD